MSSKKLIVLTVALVGVLSAGLAQARGHDEVQWSVTIGAPALVPVYGQPYPVYRQPYPVYRQDYYQYQQPRRWDRDGDGIPNRYDRVYNPRWIAMATAFRIATTATTTSVMIGTATASRTGETTTTAGAAGASNL